MVPHQDTKNDCWNKEDNIPEENHWYSFHLIASFHEVPLPYTLVQRKCFMLEEYHSSFPNPYFTNLVVCDKIQSDSKKGCYLNG
jgi:hypothetical protein